MRSFTRQVVWVVLLVLFAIQPLVAATVGSLIPATAPHGARVVVTGSGLSRTDVAIAFSDSSGAALTATVVTRADRFLEAIVPPQAATGAVHVTNASGALGTLAFTLAADPAYMSVATLAASDAAHNVLKQPAGVAIAPSGALYVADTMHDRIVLIAPGGVSVVAGSGLPGFLDGSALSASFKEPAGVAFDPATGNLYVADAGNNVIRSITSNGIVSTIAGDGHPGPRDGVGTAAEFKQPSGVAIDRNGNLYVADTGNSRICTITPSGAVTTIAGGAMAGFADGAAAQALFKQPQGVAVADDGTIYIADTGNNRIRKIATGIVSTVAGTGHGGFVDGGLLQAEFNGPSGVTIDDAGNLLVADAGNNLLRKIDPSAVTTIAGTLKEGFTDGAPSAAQFKSPLGIAFAGGLFVGDALNDAARIVYPELRLTGLYVHRGPLAGANTVRLFGTGFIPCRTNVTFGSTAATAITWITSTELLVTVPPSSTPGTVDVSVQTAIGTAVLTGGYEYFPPPTIASLTPHKGKIAGGDSVTLAGANFADGGDTDVTIGGTEVVNLVFNSSNSLSFATPPGSAGPADVTVTTPGGQTASSGGFIYFAPPTITSFAPTSGGTGTTVTITGTNFDSEVAGDEVLFGTTSAVVTSATSTQIVTTVPSGITTAKITVTTAGGTAVSETTFSAAVFAQIEVTSAERTIDAGGSQQLSAIGLLLGGGSTDVTQQASWISSNSPVAPVSPSGLVTGTAPGAADIIATYGGFSATLHVIVQAVSIPGDPARVAPKLDPTVVATFGDELRFLYTGSNAVQTGVAPGAINDDHASVFRGTVRRIDGSALPGVTITVLNHPEYGQTTSRAYGVYDIAMNGGGSLTLKYEKAGYISAQRLVTSQWNQQESVDDVILVGYDSQVTAIATNATSSQITRASIVTDGDGTRRATLIFPAGTNATLALPDGTTQTATTLNIRATEFTTGPNGPKAMPAALPATSAYTYCVEISADEATAVRAQVRFSKPVALYVENFLNMPVGTVIPVGFYDRSTGHWIGSQNGVVLRILSVANGIAQVDTNGDGIADDGATLGAVGIDAAEQQQLASIYTAGQTLWRTAIQHFSAWDNNWAAITDSPASPDGDASAPNQPQPQGTQSVSDGCRYEGSIIDCNNQTLGEAISITGTPFALEYNSGRIAQASRYTVTVQVTGSVIPPNLAGADLGIQIAGRKFMWTFPAAPNQSYTFTWDGLDAYGRAVQGARDASITLTYFYPGHYTAYKQNGIAWGLASWTSTPIRVRTSIPITQYFTVQLGQMSAISTGFGGWTFSAQHLFDGRGRVMYESGGVTRGQDVRMQNALALFTVAGNGQCCAVAQGSPAKNSPLYYPTELAVAADGTFYLSNGWSVQKVDPSGVITTIGGSDFSSGFTADGVPLQGQLMSTGGMAMSPDGVLYVVDNLRVRAIIDGKFVTIAGNGQWGTTGEGGPATAAPLAPNAIAFGPDGTLYIAEWDRVVEVTTDGTLQRIAGGQRSGPIGDGGPAINAVMYPQSIAVGPDGSVYENDGGSIRQITPDGVIHLVAGQYCSSSCREVQDGQLATSGSVLGYIWNIAVGPAGTILLGETYTTPYMNSVGRVRAIASNGIITTIAGDGTHGSILPPDGAFATGSTVSVPWDVKVAPDGSVYIIDYDMNAVRRADHVFPATTSTNPVRIVASADGSTADVFVSGRHMRTIDTLTGAVLQTLGYDANGELASITDTYGNVTTIERDGSGNPAAIVAPGGQRTTLSVTGGNLTGMNNPAGEQYVFGYNAAGLISTLQDPRGGLHEFTYDPSGLLIKDEDPAGGFTSLARSAAINDTTVTRGTAEGRTATYEAQMQLSGVSVRANRGTDGLLSTTTEGIDLTRGSVDPDGTTSTVTQAADPRFGMMSPQVTSTSVAMPSGLTLNASHSRTATLSDPTNPLSLVSLTDTFVLNGRTSIAQYQASTRTLTSTSAANRFLTAVFDTNGRISTIQPTGLTSTMFAYDGRGRVSAVQSGVRTYTFGYDANNQLTSITDPLSRTVAFTYDAAGRILTQTLPDQRAIGFTYDANGNVTSVTPPGRPQHGFAFTPVDLEQTYTPPAVPNGGATQYAYNKDRQLTLVTRPDTSTISLGYDGAGRLSTLTDPIGTYTYGYNAATGTLSSIAAPDGNTVTYGYDGSLLTAMNWSGAVSGSVGFTYDSDFRLTGESAGGTAINFTYDADSLLTAAGALAIQRDPQTGFVSGTTLGNVTDSWTSNSFGEPTSYSATYNGNPLFAESYTRDAAGRMASKTQTLLGTTWTTAYGYDAGGRLSTVTRDGTQIASYAYDSNSNRLTKSAPWVPDEVGTYDAQDRILTYAGATYTYMANGELQTKTDASGTTSYVYDSRGNLRGVTLPDGTVVDYVIDAQNRRVGKKVNGTLVKGWLYADQLQIIAELDGTGAVICRFVYGTRSNLPDYMIKGGATYRIISDHLGSPRLVVDVATGTIAESLAYDEFGNVTGDTAPGFQPFGFAGGLYDPDTKLVRFGARDYDAQAGRWTNQDPIGFGGGDANMYGYVFADPVNLKDARGLDAPSDVITVLTVAGEVGSLAVIGIISGAVSNISTPESERELQEQIRAYSESRRHGPGCNIGQRGPRPGERYRFQPPEPPQPGKPDDPKQPRVPAPLPEEEAAKKSVLVRFMQWLDAAVNGSGGL